MTSTPRAVAIDVRRGDSGVCVGVGVVVPSSHYAAILMDGAASATEPRVSAETWRRIEEWLAAGDAGLPSRPAPLGAAAVDALFPGTDHTAVVAHRFASMPLAVESPADLARLTTRMLPQLLKSRRAAA